MLKLTIAVVAFIACGVASPEEHVVWVASPWEHVLKRTEPGGARTVRLWAARNEYEPLRIIVRAGDRPLSDVNVVAGALKGRVGTIPAANVTLYREHYVNIFEPSYRSKAPAGWYPDALIPFVNPVDGSRLDGAKYDAAPFGVEPNTNQGIWADVYVPSDARAGEYAGALTVTAGGQRLARVPVRLTVWDFALPDTIAMRSNFGSLGGRVANRLGMDASSPEFQKVEDLYIDALLAHRCIPSSLGRIWPEWTPEGGIDDAQSGDRMRRMIEERHVNALAIPFRYRNEPEKCKAYLRDLAAYLRAKGWLDLAYIYMKDEPNSAEDYEIVRKQAALIREADPGIKRLCTEQTITSNPEWGDLYGSVDIWCPLWGLWDEETARQRLQLGEELWSYTALCQGDEKNPFWQIDFPPIVYRAPFWVSIHYGIKGFLYWSSVYWHPDQDPWTRPHFRDRYWGEGMLLYPGTDAGITGPVTSIRLKLIREAMEDFEYVTLVSRSGNEERADAIVAEVARSFTDWDHDPGAYMRARERLAQLIVAARARR
ncbi:MAG: glycoside hydrolase domain-containing protein [Armatimonadota bacterium]